MTDEITIHVAHSIGRKGGTHYAARAYAVGYFGACSYTIAIDDTVEDAERNAIRYVKEHYLRDGLQPPTMVCNHGRIPRALLDRQRFHI